jgi:hypothetical protein
MPAAWRMAPDGVPTEQVPGLPGNLLTLASQIRGGASAKRLGWNILRGSDVYWRRILPGRPGN